MPDILRVAPDTGPDDNREDHRTDATPPVALSPEERERIRVRDEDFAIVRAIQRQTSDRATARREAANEIAADAMARGMSPAAAYLLAASTLRQ